MEGGADAGGRQPAETGLFDPEILEPTVEPRDLTAGVENAMRTTGPNRVRQRVDIKRHCIALFAPCGTRLVRGSIGADDIDFVVIGMNIFFHPTSPSGRRVL